MADLVVGPLLRHVDATSATIWMETDGPAEVSVLGSRAGTFHVHGHHYAIVPVRGLEPGTITEYRVELDGQTVWPPPDAPSPVIRTPAPGQPVRVIFGSCRAAQPHAPPYTLPRDRDIDRGRGVDALYAYAQRMRSRDPESWPHALLMLGDQVYVDEGFPETRAYIRAHRPTSEPPGDEVVGFEEYTRLYRETWGDPPVRWLLSTLSTSMIFDDHDVADDWNISASWVEDMREKDWWHERIEAGLGTYWLYQHLGNLSADELERDELLAEVREAEDGWPALRAFARRADVGTAGTEGHRWSFRRDIGDTAVLFVDSRCGRVLDPGRRLMIDDAEHDWVDEQLRLGGVRHLVVATSLPLFLPRGMHDVEGWNEAACDGAWGATVADWAERLRRFLDIERWGSFQRSFHRMAGLLAAVSRGEHGEPPESITIISGDVHFSYLARARIPGGRVPVCQVVASPIRNPVDRKVRALFRFGASRTGRALGALLARGAGVKAPPFEWDLTDGPWFGNTIATLDVDHGTARVLFECSDPGAWDSPRLDVVCERALAAPDLRFSPGRPVVDSPSGAGAAPFGDARR